MMMLKEYCYGRWRHWVPLRTPGCPMSALSPCLPLDTGWGTSHTCSWIFLWLNTPKISARHAHVNWPAFCFCGRIWWLVLFQDAAALWLSCSHVTFFTHVSHFFHHHSSIKKWRPGSSEGQLLLQYKHCANFQGMYLSVLSLVHMSTNPYNDLAYTKFNIYL